MEDSKSKPHPQQSGSGREEYEHDTGFKMYSNMMLTERVYFCRSFQSASPARISRIASIEHRCCRIIFFRRY